MSDMLKLILEAKQQIADTCSIPSTMLMRSEAARSLAQRLEYQRKGEDRIRQKADTLQQEFLTPVLGLGMKIIASDCLPKHYELVGHAFRHPPPAKNRSLRLWKKLRYGKRRQYVEPIMQEFEVAFVFNEQAMREAMAPKIAEWEEQAFKHLFGLRSALQLR